MHPYSRRFISIRFIALRKIYVGILSVCFVVTFFIIILMVLSVSVMETLLLCENFNCTNCVLLVFMNLCYIDVYFKFTFAISYKHFVSG